MSAPARTVLVTGVSRRQGIGASIAGRLLADGCHVFAQSWSTHDAAQPWGADPGGVAAVLDQLGSIGDRLAHVETDLGEPAAPARLMATAQERFGTVDALVLAHAHSSDQSLGQLTADELDRSWAVNVRAGLLLAQSFAEQYVHRDRWRRTVHLGSAPWSDADRAALRRTKGALHQLTLSLADAVADRGITVNCLDPGPTDTG